VGKRERESKEETCKSCEGAMAYSCTVAR
jgi:hypothetical protein